MASPRAGDARDTPTTARGHLLLRESGSLVLDGHASLMLEPKDALLLAYLAIKGPTPRGRLALLLWPDVDDERARGNLRQRLLRLKRTTGVELVAGNPLAQLAEGLGHDLEDTHELLTCIEPEQAGGLSEWLEAERERRRRGHAERLDAAVVLAESRGDFAAALEHAIGLLDLDTLSEQAHRHVMRLHYLRGDVGAALAAYERCARMLRSELNAGPSEETRQLRGYIANAGPAAKSATALKAVPVTIARPPRLIGRESELATLAQAWDEGRAFLLLGEAGMGKSRTLAEFVHENPRVILAQARPGDAGVPYATLARLLRTVIAGEPGELPEGSRKQLARVLPEFQPASATSPEGQRFQLQQAIESVLLNAQTAGTQGILLDDVHFADEASIDMLRTILGGDQEFDVRWGFAQRSGEPTLAVQALRGTLEEALELSTVALTPLDVRRMADLVDSLNLPGIDGRATAERLVRHTGGNPMFALETLKHALVTDMRDSQLPRPASVGVLIERRLRQLSAPAIALARVAAVAGVDFSIHLAERVLDTPAMALADAWNELEAAQVLKGAAFAHDLVFEAALRSMPEAIAIHTHASIAECLEHSQGEPARIAAHWEATSTPQRALPWLHKAASRAHAAMRAREAVDFLVRAATIEADSVSPEQAFNTLSSIVDTRFTVDPDPTLLPLLDRLDQLAANVSQKIEALLLRADYFMHRVERLDAGIDAAKRAVELATHAGQDWYRVGGGLSVAILESMQGHYESAARGVNDLLAEARRWPDPSQRCNLLCKAAFVFLRSARTAQAVELYCEAANEAHACNYPSTRVIALANAAYGLLRLQRPREALARLEESEALRAAHDSLEGSGNANDLKAAVALRLLGRYSEALQRAQMAVERFRIWTPGKVTSAIVSRAHIWLDLGQLARARQDRELALRLVLDPVAAQDVSLLDLRLAVESAAVAENAGELGSALLQQQLQPYMELQAKLLLIGFAAPAAAKRSALSVIDAARAAECRGLEAAAMSRAAMAEMETGDTEAAVAHARLALEMAGQQNTEDLSWIAIVRNAVVVLGRGGLERESLRLLRAGTEWLEQVAAQSVPPEFRDSFLNRNPINRELLTLATRLK